MAFIFRNILWDLPLMVPGEDVAEASGNHLLYKPWCSAGNSISRRLTWRAAGHPGSPGDGSARGRSWGWRCVQWVLGSLSTGRPLSILPRTAGHPPCFLICQPEVIIASCLSGWAVRRGSRAVHWEGCSGWKCSDSISAERKPETPCHRGEHLLPQRLGGESGDWLGSGDVCR